MSAAAAWLDVVGVDPDAVEQNAQRHLAVQNGAHDYKPILVGAPLTAKQQEVLPAGVSLYEEYHSHDKTISNGLRGIAGMINSGCDVTPCIRPNVGTGSTPTAFGAVQEVFEDKMPWVTEHVPLTELDDFDPAAAPDSDCIKLALARAQYMQEALAGSGITANCWDTQSPFDVAHLVIGDDIFFAMFDEPERLKALIDKCADMIIRHRRAFYAVTGQDVNFGRDGGNVTMRGGVRLSEDTLTLLSEEQLHEFAVPYSRKVLAALGGGFVHYCGRNDHLFDAVVNHMPECHMLNFGQPDLHDMKEVLQRLGEAGKAYCGSVPRQPDEGLQAYFERVLEEAAGGGLILQPALRQDEDRSAAVQLWRKLQKAA